MTGSSILPRKRHKWLGRLLGCFSAKRNCGGRSDNQGWPLEEPGQGPDYNDNREQRLRKSPQHFIKSKTAWRTSRDPPAKEWAVCGSFLGELEWALLKEGLLEYRDPTASIPVLSICHGFSDEELRTLSKRWRCLQVGGRQRTTKKLNPLWNGQVKEAVDKMIRVEYQEPSIDGLPASVWLECVEPTLSILISLNALRHRRSNLSLKKGAQGMLDSSRSRHGDFEFGPVAIFHHPGRIQQMMLLRFEFVNVPGFDLSNSNDVSQADNSSRRNFNRHRRYRDLYRPLGEGGARARDSDSLDTNHVARQHRAPRPAASQSAGQLGDDGGFGINSISSSNTSSSSSSSNSSSSNNSNNNNNNFVLQPGISVREQRLRDAERVQAASETPCRALPPGPVTSGHLGSHHEDRCRGPGWGSLEGSCNDNNNASEDEEPPTASTVVTGCRGSVAGEDSNHPSTSTSTGSQLPSAYIDLMALGDHTIWTLAPGRYVSFAVPSDRHTWRGGAAALSTQSDRNRGGAVAVAVAPAERMTIPYNGEHSHLAARLNLWSYSRRLVRRARFGMARWRSRLERSVTQRLKADSPCYGAARGVQQARGAN